ILTQDYGPEARGGSCRADVIIADAPVPYPYVKTPGILVALSQDAYNKYLPSANKDTVIIFDEDLVKTGKVEGNRLLPMPARRIAEQLGRLAVANVVMLGFFTAATRTVSVEAIKQSVTSAVPPRTIKLNMNAFDEGYLAAQKLG
ncbi:MAG: 2-oxoacid:acceptor oxidoreductase family protein, partial [Dehalococcoidales bacterium]|nr:2-oxoacid:acceptor oxidoreductase family protein [Dehalococcoidales bacterium]